MLKRVSVAVVSNDIRGFDCDVIQGASWPPIFPQTTMTWTALRISIILRTGFTFVRTPGCLDDTRPTGWDSAPAARGSRPTGCSLSGQDFRSKSALMDKPRRMVRRSDYPHPRLVLRTTPRMISRNRPVSPKKNTYIAPVYVIIRVRGWNQFE